MQENNSTIPNELRTSRMKKRLINTARALFAEKGFANTSTPLIVKTAGVTRGALYHHYSDKTQLFREVIFVEAQKVALHIKESAASDGSPRQALISGALAYFEAMTVSGRAKLLLVDGPAVLGHDEMAKIDLVTGGNELRLGLDEAIKQGELKQVPTHELADILSAAFDRAALAALNNPESKENYQNAINCLFAALLD